MDDTDAIDSLALACVTLALPGFEHMTHMAATVVTADFT